MARSTDAAILAPRLASGSPGNAGTTRSRRAATARRAARSRDGSSPADETAGNPSSASSRSRTVAALADAERLDSRPTRRTDKSAAAAVHPAARASIVDAESARGGSVTFGVTVRSFRRTFSRFTMEPETAAAISSDDFASAATAARPRATPANELSLAVMTRVTSTRSPSPSPGSRLRLTHRLDRSVATRFHAGGEIRSPRVRPSTPRQRATASRHAVAAASGIEPAPHADTSATIAFGITASTVALRSAR